jgi:hypothetical protein
MSRHPPQTTPPGALPNNCPRECNHQNTYNNTLQVCPTRPRCTLRGWGVGPPGLPKTGYTIGHKPGIATCDARQREPQTIGLRQSYGRGTWLVGWPYNPSTQVLDFRFLRKCASRNRKSARRGLSPTNTASAGRGNIDSYRSGDPPDCG